MVKHERGLRGLTGLAQRRLEIPVTPTLPLLPEG